jgi:virginiamycin B lyase
VFDETVTVSGDRTTSPSFTPAQAGTYYWVASYSGDTNNNPAVTNCGDEPVVITKASPVIATSPSPRSPIGTAVTDTATLAGGYNPTGTITFKLYGPSETPACSAPVVTNTEPVSAGAVTSAPFTPAQAGTYWWTASYDGDTNHNPAVTNCGDESVVITPPSHLYWANHFGQGGGRINEANLDGSNPHAIVTGNEPFGVAVDISHIYWADMLTGTINEANLDGSNSHAIVTGQNEPAAVAVDSSHLYWTNFSTSTINQANLDGSNPHTIISGQNNAFGMAVDSSHLYWTCNCSNGTINQANLDGTGVTTLLSGLNSPYGVAVDSSHLYWTSIGTTGTINEANLNGANPHAIASGQGTPTGVAVDSSHLYWANGVNATGTISEANLDGTGVTILASGQDTPRGVAAGPQ